MSPRDNYPNEYSGGPVSGGMVGGRTDPMSAKQGSGVLDGLQREAAELVARLRDIGSKLETHLDRLGAPGRPKEAVEGNSAPLPSQPPVIEQLDRNLSQALRATVELQMQIDRVMQL